MQRQTIFNVLLPFALMIGVTHHSAGQPSAEVCADNGGPEICVRFDNLANPPQVGTDMDFDLNDPNNPSVELLRGHDGLIERQWRVWSKNGAVPGDIGSITATADFDFDVKLLDPSGNAGAANVGVIDLRPIDAGNYSSLTDGLIEGDLSASLALQQASGGSGGEISLIIDGDVVAGSSITIPVVQNLRVNGKVAGAVIVGTIQSTLDARLEIFGGLSGLVRIANMTNGVVAIDGKVESTALIDVTYGTANPNSTVDIDFDLSGEDFDGDVFLPNGIPAAHLFSIRESDIAAGATIDLNGQDITGGLILDGGFGDVVNINTISGTLRLAHVAGEPTDPFSGTVTLNTLAGTITTFANGDIDGVITILGDVLPNGRIDIAGRLIGIVNISDAFSGTFSAGAGLTGTGRVLIDGSIASTAFIDLDRLAGEVVYDFDGNGVGTWSGTIDVGGNVLTPACYWQDSSIGGGSIYSGLQAMFDCNTNGAPDACDIDGGSSADCNTDGVPEDCVLADADLDGDVDLQDFSAFQPCFATTDELCLAAFDRALACGAAIDLADLGVLVDQLTGPFSGGEFAMGGGGSGGGESAMGAGGDGFASAEGLGGSEISEAEPAEVPPSWTIEYVDASLEVRLPGTESAVTSLAPDTSDELHYSANVESASGYVVFAVASEAGQGIVGGSAPAAGPWSATGNFAVVDLAGAGAAVPAPGFADGYLRQQMVTDEVQSAETAESYLCTFTTGSSGELNLQLLVFSVDSVALHVIELNAEAVFAVEP